MEAIEKMPLWEAVEGYRQQKAARFHMPGHKGHGDEPFAEILPYDITEVAGADSLYEASGPIAALEEQFAVLYGTRRSLLSAGGATLCIQAMLALACGIGSQVIISRNIHRSAIYACALLDLAPVWVYPDESAGSWFSGRYTPASVEAALREHPDAAAVYITSPDYFGVASDLGGIAAVCKRYAVPLLVDNAHGAHLPFLPAECGLTHPIACGAALCADSLHKTLPAMTGGALLQIGDERFCSGAKEAMALFGSSSPSYPILLSCERAAVYALTRAKTEFAQVAGQTAVLEGIARAQGLVLPEGPRDPAKLSLGFAACGRTAKEFGNYLRENNIEPEYLSAQSAVLMLNGCNSAQELGRLREVLMRFSSGSVVVPSQRFAPLCCPVAMRVREAAFAQREWVAVEACAGRIAAAVLAPCPPGIPIVMSGERFTDQAAQILAAAGIEGVWAVAQKKMEFSGGIC